MNLRLWLLTLVAALACSAQAQPSQPPDLAEIVGKHPIAMFSTLSSLFASAGMTDVLAGKNLFTLLAPDNAAFAKLSKAALRN